MFGHRLHSQFGGEVDDGAHDRAVGLGRVQLGDELPVDLDEVEQQVPQID